jgi:hypothetical protein
VVEQKVRWEITPSIVNIDRLSNLESLIVGLGGSQRTNEFDSDFAVCDRSAVRNYIPLALNVSINSRCGLTSTPEVINNQNVGTARWICDEIPEEPSDRVNMRLQA